MMNVRKRAFRGWGFGVLAFLALAIGAYALVLYGTPEGLRQRMFVSEKGALPELWYNVLFAHAVSAGVALAVGWFQFMKRLRLRMPGVHRAIGCVYAVMIAIGGMTGLYLAFYANGGWIAQAGFGSLSVLWLYTLYRSLKSILVDRDPREHGRWMVRNYALSCAAISLRLYIPLAAVLFGLTDTNDTFAVIAWIAWIPNLLIAERLIGRRNAAAARS
ncbi:DUF2306 domain-containing protein [Paenibacillus sp. MBLB4367]|uniref:DUF2306 domain-containing protein n=1 Tax=Paenibacillus sp. MBLB4367 TaxID=3384767 RepID=UPI00390817A6